MPIPLVAKGIKGNKPHKLLGIGAYHIKNTKHILASVILS